MDDETRRRLNALNREFYRLTAQAFDETRGKPWPGWDRLLPYLKLPLSALDVGCGNGRFGLFLVDKLHPLRTSTEDERDRPSLLQPNLRDAGQALTLAYHGIDSNPTLLDRARGAFGGISGLRLTLEERDAVENPLDSGSYDLVAVFGLLHHVPGYEQRQGFLRALAERVAPGGLLAFACWRFYEYARFRERIVAWPPDLKARVEPHDYLLEWRRGLNALRYCHYVDDAEHLRLVAATGLREIETYRADGFTGAVNRYSLLRKS